jgi:hypothetical protein
MKNKLTQLAAVLSLGALAFTTGCATIMEGSDQAINVNTVNCEEYGMVVCTLSNKDGASTISVPATANVEKTKGALTVSCESKERDDRGPKATGRKVIDSQYEAMNAGNILAGGIIGMGVDAATGAMWKYPSTVVVPMRCAPKS